MEDIPVSAKTTAKRKPARLGKVIAPSIEHYPECKPGASCDAGDSTGPWGAVNVLLAIRRNRARHFGSEENARARRLLGWRGDQPH